MYGGDDCYLSYNYYELPFKKTPTPITLYFVSKWLFLNLIFSSQIIVSYRNMASCQMNGMSFSNHDL
jgi:hypothetical protein